MRVPPMAYIEHQIPGRMRLRVPERRGDVGFFQSIVGTLSKLPEITELDGFPLSGSIRIRHTGTPDAILAAAAEQGLFEIGKQESDAEPKKPRKQPHGDAGMLDTIATGLSGLALFQVTQGQITGSAAENFWHAFGAERMLGSSVVAAGFGLLGLYQLLQGQWLGSASSLFFYALAAHQLATFQQAPSATTDLTEPPKPPRKQRKPPRKKRGPQKAREKIGISRSAFP
jgi:hypothetical protein